MTQQRRDGNSTEFGLWTRKPEQREIDSKLGFVTSNIDFVWKNYHSGLWMLLEEKRYRYMPKPYQVDIYRTLDNAGRTDTLYRGFHLLVFENASPDDGGTWLDGRYISRDDLIKFMRFEQTDNWYTSYFPDRSKTRIAYPEAVNEH